MSEKESNTNLNRRQFIKFSGIGSFFVLTSCPNISFINKRKEGKMPYSQKDYTSLIGMQGFSETLLKNHFTLYQGYVTNTNKVMDILNQMLKDGKTAIPEYAELKRRIG